MKELKIFIASSNDEAKERILLENTIRQLSNITQFYNVMITPVMWELLKIDFLPALERKQNEYNTALETSDLIFFIIGNRVGKYTREEFDNACKQLKKMSHLKVYVLFKNFMPKRDEDVLNYSGVIQLKEYISRELSQVYGEYDSDAELLKIFVLEVLRIVFKHMTIAEKPDKTIQELIELYNECNKLYQIDNRNSPVCQNSCQ